MSTGNSARRLPMKKQSKRRIVLTQAIEAVKGMIEGQEFLNAARKRPQDFTRNRKMPTRVL
jgi:hypothetical protein